MKKKGLKKHVASLVTITTLASVGVNGMVVSAAEENLKLKQEQVTPKEDKLIPAEENQKLNQEQLTPKEDELIPAEENQKLNQEQVTPREDELIPAEENQKLNQEQVTPKEDELIPAEGNSTQAVQNGSQRGVTNVSVIGWSKLNAQLSTSQQVDLTYTLKYVVKIALLGKDTTYFTFDSKVVPYIDKVQYKKKGLLSSSWVDMELNNNVASVSTTSLLNLDLLGLLPVDVDVRLILKNGLKNGTYEFDTMQKADNLIDAAIIENSQAHATLKVGTGDDIPPNKPIVNNVTDQDTKVTGTGEAGSKVTVAVGDQKYEGKVDGNGNFTVDIPKQKPGTEIKVTLTDDSDNVSEPSIIMVKDMTAPETPVVKEVTDESTKVTGTGEAGSKVTVAVGDQKYEGKVDENGNFTVDIPKQKPGTEVTVTLTDASDNVSKPSKVTVTDVTAPEAPVVKEVTDESTKVTGTGEAGSKVTVAVGDQKYEGKVDGNGNFTVDIPKQKPGTEVTVKLTDTAGNTSKPSKVTVKDGTVPEAPVVKGITDKDTKVIGTGEVGSKVTVTMGDQKYEGKVDENGNFTVDIPKQKPGTEVTVTLTDAAGNASKPSKVTVKDVTAPEAPVVKGITDKDTKVIGTGEAGSRVTVTISDQKYEGKVDENGNFTVDIPKQKPGTEVTVTLTDAAGNTSKPSKAIVSETIANINAKINKPLTTSHMYVTGTATEGTAKVALYINGKFIRTAAIQPDGSYRVFIDKSYRVENNEVKVLPLTEHGKEGIGDTTKIKKENLERLPAPTINPVHEIDNYVMGTIDSKAKRVALYVNGKFIRYGAVDEATGTYKIYKERALAPAGAEIKVLAVDENNIDGYSAQTIALSDTVVVNAPDVKPVFFGDNYVTGKYAEGTKGIKLYINNKFVRYGALDSTNETFKIYLDKTLAPAGTELKIVPVSFTGKEGTSTIVVVKGR
ncbi:MULTISPECIES: Ig-like domain-containing protein [Bacillus cereus group]|uniref:Ig-like domain-containing protein n=1 Tax=Bacillus cereus group TaxID=86661 RepID=UPI00119E613B|nr:MULTISPECIES: Ig-like domain-containing protein [Bacillus cereus group]MDH4422855.1 Ig-like domain-containing protein [Bacillus cereus]